MGKNNSKELNQNKSTGSINSPITATPKPANDHIHPVLTQEQKKNKIIEKLMANEIYRKKLELRKDIMEQFASVLCNEKALLDTYLQTSFLKTVEMLNEIKQKTDDETVIKQRRPSMFQSVQSINMDVMTVQDKARMRQSENDEIDEFEEEELKESANDPDVTMNLVENTVKVKIVVSEIVSDKARKGIRRLVAPVMSKLDIAPQLGMFHSALIIGPWYIEWNNSAICVPRKCLAGSAFLTADIDDFDSVKDIESLTHKLAEVIVDWNINKGYKDHGGDKTRVGNCQDFVEDVLKRLGMKTAFTGPLGEFTKKLRDQGKCDMILYLDEDFQEKFSIKDKKIKFETHKQIDEFAERLLEIDCEANFHHKAEWGMLKNFDRALWLRHFKFKDDEKWKPMMKIECDDDGDECESLGCPFGDPVATYSIRVQK